MNNLQAGFARVNVTPMMGICINGYFKDRIADGVLDELEDEMRITIIATGFDKKDNAKVEDSDWNDPLYKNFKK